MPDGEAPRSFSVTSSGLISVLSIEDHVALLRVSPAASAGWDLLTDDGVTPGRAWRLVLASERAGRDAEKAARRVVRLRRAYLGQGGS
jgi:hypothetical protein